MNSLEAGRQRAERLHDEAVLAGHDPRNPYEFVRAEATKRLIDVERVPKGDIRLHGGRALYDPDALLILHEDSDDIFLDAFLVAHELGHIELGGQTEAMAVTDADPLRAAEAVPIGVERVVDYSRRQRREVQMDLFAREFLLPRSWLRELHVAQGMNASQISAYASAPFPVVAQQLLDALLLPRIEIETKDQAPERPLAPDGFFACAGFFGAGCFAAKKTVDAIGDAADRAESQKNNAIEKEKREAEASAKAPGEWSQVGDVRIGIYAVRLGKPIVVDEQGRQKEWDEPLLQIAFNVENLSKKKKLDYRTPDIVPFGRPAVMLVDEHGNDYRYRAFTDTFHLRDSPRYGKTLNPGDKALVDSVCFQAPVSAATVLRLTMGSPVKGETRKHEFRIPSSSWKIP